MGISLYLKSECEFQAAIDQLCDNATSHGYLINAEIRWNEDIGKDISKSVVVSSMIYYVADIFEVSPNKLHVLNSSFPSCVSRKEGIFNSLVANKCQAVLNFTMWLDYNEYGRYFDDLISVRSSYVTTTGDFIPQRLDIVRGCRDTDSLPIDLCLGNLDDIKNTTNLNMQNNSQVCLDEACTHVALTRNLKTAMHFINTSNEELTVSYTKQVCIVRWCNLYSVNVNNSFDDYNFVKSAIELIEKPLQMSLTVSRWNQTHVLVCSSRRNNSGVFQVPHQILTLVGCVISIVALVLTLLTYARFPLLRRSTFVKLIMGLATTLFIGQLLSTNLPWRCRV